MVSIALQTQLERNTLTALTHHFGWFFGMSHLFQLLMLNKTQVLSCQKESCLLQMDGFYTVTIRCRGGRMAHGVCHAVWHGVSRRCSGLSIDLHIIYILMHHHRS